MLWYYLATLFATRCSWLFSTELRTHNLFGGLQLDYLSASNHLKCWWRLSRSDLNHYKSLYVDPCYYRRARNSRLAWRPSLSRVLMEKALHGWNLLLIVDVAMLQRRLSLCLAILTKSFQEIITATNFSFHLASMTLIIFVIWAS